MYLVCGQNKVMTMIITMTISLLLMINIFERNRFIFVDCRYDYNRIKIDRKQVLLYKQIELACSLRAQDSPDPLMAINKAAPFQHNHHNHHHPHHQSKSMTDVVMLIFWFKGLNAKAPFLIIDTRHHYGSQRQMVPSSPSTVMTTNERTAISGVALKPSSKLDYVMDTLSNGSSPSEAVYRSNGVTDSFLERASYRIDYQQQVAFLLIERVQAEDEGIYRCRVDYRHSRTTNRFIHLELIIPPTKVFIRDHNDTFITDGGLAGPYLEGQYIELICETKQATMTDGSNNQIAKPLPQVLWYEGSTLIDDSYELVFDSHSKRNAAASFEANSTNTFNYLYKALVRARNRLKLIQPLMRNDLLRQFRCVATNNDMIEPVSSVVNIDLILPPINVEIVLSSKEAFHKGQNAQILCRSHGSRPVAQLHWYRHGQRVLSRIEDYYDVDQNFSRSIMRFVPDENDDGSEIVCQAINIRLDQGQAIQDEQRIIVHYMPIIQLSLIQSQNMLTENSSVRFRCAIRANPFPNKPAIWFYNATPIQQSDDRFTVLDDNQLAIDCLRPQHHDGNYYCLAENSLGRNRNAPRCRRTETYAVAINETITIVCEVDARPSLVYFNWYHNGTAMSVNHHKYTTRGSQSVLMFMPRDRYDYGQLSCVAQNSIGKTKEPCVYTVIPFGPPEPIHKCIVDMLDERYSIDEYDEQSSPKIKCQYHFNGGIDTYCRLEIYRPVDHMLIWNMTDNIEQSNGIDSCIFDYPITWLMANISHLNQYRIKLNVLTFNQQGSSKPYIFYTHLPKIAQTYATSTKSSSSNSLIPLILNHISDLNDTSSMNDANSSFNNDNASISWNLPSIIAKLFKLLVTNGNWIFALIFLLLSVLMGFLVRTIVRIQQLKHNNHINEHIIMKRFSITNHHNNVDNNDTLQSEMMITPFKQYSLPNVPLDDHHDPFDYLYDQQTNDIMIANNKPQHVLCTTTTSNNDQFVDYIDDNFNQCLYGDVQRKFIKFNPQHPTSSSSNNHHHCCSSSSVITLV
ncbi:hypothetical protein DERP_012177 [Dermatophagoides pteronyssinus]|uniref:Ig-like domain-containing protein n=1 Tax=Dermatophagoides pteronyssinus TaxID=6956 RepID=A0ABQ8J2F2_DERPT|nr:hypothetical protein DERP_012177 [Dermatophagoides pteronyssinus]